jgi:hypothetical protein
MSSGISAKSSSSPIRSSVSVVEGVQARRTEDASRWYLGPKEVEEEGTRTTAILHWSKLRPGVAAVGVWLVAQLWELLVGWTMTEQAELHPSLN